MRETRSITWDLATWEILDHDSVEYFGVWELCKGADTADAQRKQELSMQTQAFNTQQSQLKQLQSSLQGYLSGKQGYSPQAMSGMTSQFLNNNNQTFNQAGQQVRSALGARGSGTGQLPAGGDYTRGIAGLMAAKAGNQSSGLLGLNVQNQQQALQNQFNAANVLSGNAATLTGTQGVAGAGASSALNSYESALQASFGGQFMGALGKGLGSGVASGITGGAGAGLSGLASRGAPAASGSASSW